MAVSGLSVLGISGRARTFTAKTEAAVSTVESIPGQGSWNLDKPFKRPKTVVEYYREEKERRKKLEKLKKTPPRRIKVKGVKPLNELDLEDPVDLEVAKLLRESISKQQHAELVKEAKEALKETVKLRQQAEEEEALLLLLMVA